VAAVAQTLVDSTGRRNTSRWRWAMGVRERQAAVRAMCGQMWSPGRPSKAGREDRVRFWEAIARGMSSEDAAGEAGCRRRSGRGGSVKLAGCHRSRWSSVRPLFVLCRAGGDRGPARSACWVRAIARHLGRAPSTISRELRRNASTRRYRLEYRASTAQWHAERRASRPKVAKLAMNDRLREYVQDRLAGAITRPDGELVAGPEVRWIGRRHGRRQDRCWARSWSPEQIANRLWIDFPHDESMRISHEAIYQALYVQGRGALRRELVACLRTGRALRVPPARTRDRGKKLAGQGGWCLRGCA
jgi:hypothetical protein